LAQHNQREDTWRINFLEMGSTMFEQILSYRAHINWHSNGPYAPERERYLPLLVTEGRSRSVLRAISKPQANPTAL